jgi:hypothetical protein
VFRDLSVLSNPTNPTNPVDKLPSEVLGGIFILVLRQERSLMVQDDDSVCWECSSGVPACLRTITSVCHHWRNVALDTGILWTVIDLSFRFPLERGMGFIRRSKQCPLSLECDFEGLKHHDPFGPILHAAEVGRILRAHAPRFTFVSLLGRDDQLLMAL